MSESKTNQYEKIEDPGLRAFLLEGDRFYPADAVNFSISEQRAFYDRYCEHFRKPRPHGVLTEDFAVGSIPCRRYRNTGFRDCPVLLYLHGGGLILGSLESHDDVCAEICAGAHVEVVAVHYRLAPENVFPAAIDDAWAVLCHVAAQHDRLIVGGDSAGGGLAAALTLRARDAGGPHLRGQVLIYPGLGGDTTRGSYVTQASAPGLSTSDVLYYRDIYRGGGSKLARPLLETQYAGLPPAFLVAAGLDPLHDDCFAYAERLQSAGVSAIVRDEPLLVHAFLRARHMSEPARESFAAIVAAVQSLSHYGILPDQTSNPRAA